MDYKKDLSKIAEILTADYVWDPKHEKNPGSGWKKTEKGWSKTEGGNRQTVYPVSTKKIGGKSPEEYASQFGSTQGQGAAHFYNYGSPKQVKDETFYDEFFNGKGGIKEVLKQIEYGVKNGVGGFKRQDMIDFGQFALHVANEARRNGIDIDKIVDGKSDNPVKKPETFSKEQKMKMVREMPGYWSGLNKLQKNRLSWDDFHSRVMDGSISLGSDEALAMAAVLKIKQEEQLDLAESHKKREKDPFAQRALQMTMREADKLGKYSQDFNNFSLSKTRNK